MADYIEIELVIVEPVMLELDVAPSTYIGTAQAGPTGPAGENGLDGEAASIGDGARYSSVHAGELKQLSMDDDYLYICTTAGTAGNAVWKKTPLFKSN